MNRALVFGAAIACASCTQVPSIDPGCGNGFLEPGEDCDTSDPRCVACGWRCDPDDGVDGDCTTIPAPRDGSAYLCGVDHVCHAPGGAFAGPGTPQPFSADRFAISDVDHDRYGDAVGLSSVSLVSRFGDAAGSFDRERDVVTPAVGGAPAIADLDGDRVDDVLVPARDGLVAYASPEKVLSPYAIAFPLPFATSQILAAFPIDAQHVGVLYVAPNNSVVGAALDVTTPGISWDLKLCSDTYSADPADFDPASVDYYNTSGLADIPRVMVSFVAKASGQTCVVEVDETTPTTFSVKTLAIDATPAPSTRPVLADVDGNGCPSVVMLPSGQPLLRYRAMGTRGSCSVSTTSFPVAGDAGDSPVGRVRLSPPIPNTTPDALVLTRGIYAVLTSNTSLTPLFTSDRALTAAASGDVDGDGRTDAIVIGADPTIDVLYRTTTPDGFLRVRLATSAPPSHLTVADFDGNGIADVAYIEAGVSGQSLEISYGTLDRASPAIDVAQFSDVAITMPIALVDSEDPNGLTADLAVVDRRPAHDPVLVAFHGNPDRTLVPFLDPRIGVTASTFRAVAGGHFVSGSSLFDLFAIEFHDPSNIVGVAVPSPMLWRLAGASIGTVDLPDGTSSGETEVDVQAIRYCADDALVDMQMPNGYCLDHAEMVTWPGTTDQVVGIDPIHARALVLDPAAYTYGPAGDPTMTTIASTAIAGLPTGSTLRNLFRADLDGDGTPELVIAYTTPTGGGVLACAVTTVVTCVDLIDETPELAGATCTAAAVGHLALAGQAPSESAPSTELVVSCETTLYRLAHDGFGFHASMLFTLPFAPDALEVGDVTGDRIDDVLVAGTGANGVHQLLAFPQLTSREVGR